MRLLQLDSRRVVDPAAVLASPLTQFPGSSSRKPCSAQRRDKSSAGELSRLPRGLIFYYAIKYGLPAASSFSIYRAADYDREFQDASPSTFNLQAAFNEPFSAHRSQRAVFSEPFSTDRFVGPYRGILEILERFPSLPFEARSIHRMHPIWRRLPVGSR